MALTMTARPSAEMLTSGTRGLNRRKVASTGRRHVMTTISIAIIILVLIDLGIIARLRDLENMIIGVYALVRGDDFDDH